MEGRCNGHRYTVYSFSNVSFVDLDNDTPQFAGEPNKDERAKKRHANLDAEVSYGTSCSASPVAYDTDGLPGLDLVLISDTSTTLGALDSRDHGLYAKARNLRINCNLSGRHYTQPKWHGRMWYQPRAIHSDKKTSACMQYSFDHFLNKRVSQKSFAAAVRGTNNVSISQTHTKSGHLSGYARLSKPEHYIDITP